MTEEQMELLSALVDGERVEPASLAEALADPEATEVLLDFARMRVEMEADPVRPGDAFYLAAEAHLSPTGWRLALRRSKSAAAALGWLAAGLLWWTAGGDGPDRPRAEPSPSPDVAVPVAAPAPARLLRFEPGVDWWPQDHDERNGEP